VFDVFISHSSKDKVVADALKHRLEASSVRTWKAPENIQPGQVWEEAITEAISICRITLLIWSTDSQDSQQVKRELALAASMDKIVIPLRIQNLRPEGAFAYYLTNTHWLDAFLQDQENALLEVVDRVHMILKAPSGGKPIDAGGSNNKSSDAGEEEPIIRAIATKSGSSRINSNNIIHRDSKGKHDAVEEIEGQTNMANCSRTEALSWTASRTSTNYFKAGLSENILLTQCQSGISILVTAEVSLTGVASISIDGQMFDAVPLGLNEYCAEAEFMVNDTSNSLYMSFACISHVRASLLVANGLMISIAY